MSSQRIPTEVEDDMSDLPDTAWVLALELHARDAIDAIDTTAAEWLAKLDIDEHPVMARRLMLVRAVADTRRGRFGHGVATIREIRQWAIQHEERYVQGRCERVLALVLRLAGDVTTSLGHAVTSVEMLDDDDDMEIRADHLTGLADSLTMCGSPLQAIERYREALESAERTDDIRLQMLVINNWTYTCYLSGELDEALRLSEKLQALGSAHGEALAVHSLDTVATVYVAFGRLDEAEATLQMVDHYSHATPEDTSDSFLTLLNVRRLRGDGAGAQEALDQCLRIAQENELGGIEVRCLAGQAELYADAGRFDDALAKYQEYHDRLLAQHTMENEARARMMQVIFETAEARRDSERYREMSYRDPLTTLHNRRYVDDHFIPMLQKALAADRPMSVAFVDLDHFKRINDTCSHEVGDEVLRRVTAVLQEYAERLEGGFVARMGGEEFLLVMPDLDATAAAELLEQVRAAVQALEWDGLTHELPVTASLGAATAPQDGVERLLLLNCADQRLYVAKDNGRNQVVSTDAVEASELVSQ